jgi:signal transduction histidine kinase
MRPALVASGVSNEPRFLLSNLAPSLGQRRLAVMTASLLILAFGITAPFVTLQLPRVDAFIPLLQSTFFVCDVITTLLLFSQFSISRSTAILVLASGYFFVSLIVIVHLLTFPGVFSPSGLLGAGLQSTAWLYFFWHLGLTVAILAYVYLKKSDHRIDSTRLAIVCSSLAVLGLVYGIAWLCTAGERLLPPFFQENLQRTPLTYQLGIATITLGGAALVALWTHRRSVLDQWLMVVTLAVILEVAMLVIVFNGTAARFHLGFYAGRIYTLFASFTILIALIAEMARADSRLARANAMLERERANKMVSAAAVATSITHGLRQPLTAIDVAGNTALQRIQEVPPDLDKVQTALSKVVGQCHDASHAIENIGELFKGGSLHQERVNVNNLAAGVFQILSGDLARNHTTARIKLVEGLPAVLGQSGQLRGVLLNLVTCMIEAMEEIVEGKRILLLETKRRNTEDIAITVEVSGSGFDPVKLAALLDPSAVSKTLGAGFGLAICQMIVEQHGGQLSVHSSTERCSATLQCILPIHSAESAHSGA